MSNYIVRIGNINHTNEHWVQEIAGAAGYAGCVNRLDDCNAVLETGDGEFRKSCGVALSDVDRMVGMYVRCGFTVTMERV